MPIPEPHAERSFRRRFDPRAVSPSFQERRMRAMETALTSPSSDATKSEGLSRTLYLIFSHGHQHQLHRLASAIHQLSPNALIVIHHDPTQVELDHDLFAGIPQVHFIPDPVHGEWGGYSLVEQYLHSLRWCLDNLDWDWLCTLTGLSYPINSLREFESKLAGSGYDSFIRHFDAFDPGPWPKGVVPKGTGETRYWFRYFKLPKFPYWHKVPARLRGFLSKARQVFNDSQPLFRIIPMPRGGKTRFGARRFRLPFPPGFTLCGGRQMLNLNREACRHVFDFLEKNPGYEGYFRRALIPDEGFFTSILANDRHLRVCNDVLRYIKWPKGIGATSVAVIARDEVNEAMQSGAPFGLKFDAQLDPAALDYIDETLGLKTSAPPRLRPKQFMGDSKMERCSMRMRIKHDR